jgi:hypothetical protein
MRRHNGSRRCASRRRGVGVTRRARVSTGSRSTPGSARRHRGSSPGPRALPDDAGRRAIHSVDSLWLLARHPRLGARPVAVGPRGLAALQRRYVPCTDPIASQRHGESHRRPADRCSAPRAAFLRYLPGSARAQLGLSHQGTTRAPWPPSPFSKPSPIGNISHSLSCLDWRDPGARLIRRRSSQREWGSERSMLPRRPMRNCIGANNA